MTSAGLVLDIGHREATIVPVYEGVPILAAWQALPLAGEAIQETVKSDLIERGLVTSSLTAANPRKVRDSQELLTEKLLEEITVTCCFVTNANRGRDLQQLLNPSSGESPTTRLSHLAPLVNYPISGSEFLQVLLVPYSMAWSVSMYVRMSPPPVPSQCRHLSLYRCRHLSKSKIPSCNTLLLLSILRNLSCYM